MKSCKWALALLIGALCSCIQSGCAGGASGWPEAGYPPEAPRQPERLRLLDPNITDPLQWWRVNIYNQLPSDTYSCDTQALCAGEVVAATNTVRASYGLPPVQPLPLLHRVAQAHAFDQGTRDYWSHHTPEGLTSWQRVQAVSELAVLSGGENSTIANPGSHTPSQVVQGWLRHPGHRELLLNPKVRYIGVGVYCHSSGEWMYYVQLMMQVE